MACQPSWSARHLVCYASEEYPSMMPFLRVLLYCFLYFRVYFVRNGKLLSTHGTNAETVVTKAGGRVDIARNEVEAVRAVAVIRIERTRPVVATADRIVETAAIAVASSRQENINTAVKRKQPVPVICGKNSMLCGWIPGMCSKV